MVKKRSWRRASLRQPPASRRFLFASHVSFDSRLANLGAGYGLAREGTVFRVEKEIAISQSDRQRASYSQDGAPVVLRSTPKYPLLVDPEYRAAAEYFGVLRARLLNARNKSDFRSFVITSAQKQDGKTFSSINLAISLAQLQQMRILLVDGDLRFSSITGLLELEQTPGLADFLQNWSPFEECVRSTTLSHLYVAPAGNVSVDSVPAILEGSRWPHFMQKAKQEFDLVIVDSVPVSAPIADFELLLNACDAALLVVHIRKTTREALDFVTNQMQGKLLGLIVNNKQLRPDLSYHAPYGGK
jgi:capsular exopolysaccharide synthesis family protein